MHTTATDGEATLAEMAAAAVDRGLSYIAITDHSKRVTMARGLDEKRLYEQWAEIDRLNESLARDELSSLVILKGIEVDILEKGGLDLPDDVLSHADWVVASLHYGQQQSQEQITDRLLDAICHPYVNCIGHPTGRLLIDVPLTKSICNVLSTQPQKIQHALRSMRTHGDWTLMTVFLLQQRKLE